MKHTVKCIRCFKPAKMWGGHVRRGKEDIIAGWCSERCLNVKGFNGQYVARMGETTKYPEKP